MPDWMSTLKSFHEHRKHLRAARKYYIEKYGKPVNLTVAIQEYSISVGNEKDWLNINSKSAREFEAKKKEYRDTVLAGVDGVIRCPKCGGYLTVEPLPRCGIVNPLGYSCVFCCYPKEIYKTDPLGRECKLTLWEHSECTYHCYVRNPLIDVFFHVKENDSLDGLNIIEGIV